jgi:butyrate kinase
MMKILVINPGSTSTKVALFEDNKELVRQSLSHSKDELSKFKVWTEQLDYRHELVMDFLQKERCRPKDLSCVISRGGSPPGIHAGATEVDDKLVDALLHRPLEPHPASLGPVIAKKIAEEAGIPAYVYDPITSDEINPLAKVYGVKGIEHNSMCHFLNTHAMGIKLAEQQERDFNKMTIMVAHIGGGNSICLWKEGHPVDVVPGDACTFSAERAGFMRAEKMVQLVEEYGAETCTKWLHGKGGFVSLLDTNDLREVDKLITTGDKEALLYQKAMAYQLSKCMCSLLPAANGKIDAIIITGGGAHWKRLTDDVVELLEFLEIPIHILPGENEMQALADGAVRIMNKKESVQKYNG